MIGEVPEERDLSQRPLGQLYFVENPCHHLDGYGFPRDLVSSRTEVSDSTSFQADNERNVDKHDNSVRPRT
jgi:hypothetical protein